MLNMWVVYDRPTDFPHGYIARRWEIRPGQNVATDETMTSVDLGSLRARLEQKGLVKISRDPADEPSILETWL